MPFQVGKVVFRSPFAVQDPLDVIHKTGENIIIRTLRSIVESQRQTIVQLERKMEDLGKQNEELRSAKTITTQEAEMFKNQSQHIISLQTQLDQLALWLRENKSVEIAQGKHNGRELVDVIMGYLGGALPAPMKPVTEGQPN